MFNILLFKIVFIFFLQHSHPHLSLLEQATLKQCVVGPNHAGFLLEVMLDMNMIAAW